jgi:hypothetical protein
MTSPLPLDEEFFRRSTAPPPYLRAVEQLVADSGRSWDEFEQLTPSQIYQVAQATYGDELPEFWRVWRDWHDGDQVQPMGDL